MCQQEPLVWARGIGHACCSARYTALVAWSAQTEWLMLSDRPGAGGSTLGVCTHALGVCHHSHHSHTATPPHSHTATQPRNHDRSAAMDAPPVCASAGHACHGAHCTNCIGSRTCTVAVICCSTHGLLSVSAQVQTGTPPLSLYTRVSIPMPVSWRSFIFHVCSSLKIPHNVGNTHVVQTGKVARNHGSRTANCANTVVGRWAPAAAKFGSDLYLVGGMGDSIAAEFTAERCVSVCVCVCVCVFSLFLSFFLSLLRARALCHSLSLALALSLFKRMSLLATDVPVLCITAVCRLRCLPTVGHLGLRCQHSQR